MRCPALPKTCEATSLYVTTPVVASSFFLHFTCSSRNRIQQEQRSVSAE